MKFRDGLWQLRPGVQVQYAVHAHDVVALDDSLVITAPTRRIETRQDTLNATTFEVSYSSPMPDVIEVRIEHFAGVRPQGPKFEVFGDDRTDVEARLDDVEGVLTSSRLAVHVERQGDWSASFCAEGRTLTGSGSRSIGLVQVDDGGRYIHEQLILAADTTVYGLGERFGPLVKNGQVVDIWNADGGTSSEQAYKNVPFYLTSDGYGVFVAEPGAVSFEVGSEHVSRVQFSVAAESLTYYVIYGPSPKEVLERYTALTGRPALPPAWSFGLWLSTSFTTSYDEGTVTYFIEEMARRNLALRVFHFDCFWMREFNWCDFEWDRRTFPDPKGLLQRLHDRGLEISLWINPYIGQRSPLFAEGAANGYLLRRPNGDVWQTDRWQPGMGIVDFTNEDAKAWYLGKLRNLLALGVSCFKTDFGERIPTDVAWADGSDPVKMHNYYSLLYNKAVFELLEEVRGKGEAVVFARSSTAGGQRYPLHWGGDNASTFSSMAETLRGGLSLGMCGFGFWSHDIGGFEGSPDRAVFKRWIAFGMLSSHSRLHGSTSYRVPWEFDEEACDVLRHFSALKAQLMPYLAAAAREAHLRGVPVMRAMFVEYPEDPACRYLQLQYMLGSDLLVAPVFTAEGTVRYYLPQGRWTHLLSGDVVEGGHWLEETYDFLSLPLFVRGGALLPVGAGTERPDYEWQDNVRLRLFELHDGARASCVVPGSGERRDANFDVRRSGSEVALDASGDVSPFYFEVTGQSIDRVEGGQFDAGVGVFIPGPGRTRITLTT